MTAAPRHTDVTSPLSSLYLTPTKAAVALSIGCVLAAAGVALAPAHLYEAILLSFALSWAAMVDIDRFILPDVITLGLLAIGLTIGALADADALLPRAIGAAVGFASLTVFAAVFRRLRGRNGLGQGDAKLLAAGGAWLGWAPLPFVLLVASLLALILNLLAAALLRRPLQEPVAFGPYLAGAIWMIWLFWPALETWLF